jgi:hypothetical protein
MPECSDAKARSQTDKPAGASCAADVECRSWVCKNRACTAEEIPPPVAVPEPKSAWKKNWLSLAVQEDALFLPASQDVCLNGTEYSCFYADNTSYDSGHPEVTVAGNADEVTAGFHLATTRVLVGFDRVLGSHFALGARAGYAFNGGPAKPGGHTLFAVHLEARASYWFGPSPFASKGFRPYVVVAGGLAEVDAKVVVKVYELPKGSPALSLAAWKKAGTAFVGGGGGVMYALNPNAGIVAEIKLVQMVGSSAFGAAMQLGYALGL